MCARKVEGYLSEWKKSLDRMWNTSLQIIFTEINNFEKQLTKAKQYDII